MLPTVQSHPLGSNQNLPGFNRARRPTTQEWDVSAACVDRACEVARSSTRRGARLQVPLRGHLIIIALRLSESAVGARRAHLGRRCTRGLRECTSPDSLSGFVIQISSHGISGGLAPDGEARKRRWAAGEVFPWAAHHGLALHEHVGASGGGPPRRYPYPGLRRRR